MSKPKLYDSAYPGSMFEREEGDFVRADDSDSLASALLRNISDLEVSRDSWKDDAIRLEKRHDELLAALTHAVEIAEAKRAGTWDDVMQYRSLIAKVDA